MTEITGRCTLTASVARTIQETPDRFMNNPGYRSYRAGSLVERWVTDSDALMISTCSDFTIAVPLATFFQEGCAARIVLQQFGLKRDQVLQTGSRVYQAVGSLRLERNAVTLMVVPALQGT